MKRFLTLLLIVFIVGAFILLNKEGSHGSTASPALPMPMTITPQTNNFQDVSEDNWHLSLPTMSWMQQDIPDTSVKLFLRDQPDQKYVVMLVKRETERPYVEYIVDILREFSEDGAEIHSLYQTNLNGQHFIRAQIVKNGEMIWLWLTTKAGFGYGLICGGDINVDAGTVMLDMCSALANTFHID